MGMGEKHEFLGLQINIMGWDGWDGWDESWDFRIVDGFQMVFIWTTVTTAKKMCVYVE